MARLIISNKEMDNVTKIIKYLEECGLLVEGVSETIENKAKEPKNRFLTMLIGIFGACLL